MGLALVAAARANDAPISPDSRPAASATEPIPWRQNLFSIPFRISPAREEATQPIEVQLFISEDRGASWRLESRVKPEQGSFTFQAPRDGEYWFAIRTVDRQNRLRPEGNPTPELRVRVETLADFHLALPETESFLKADFTKNTAEELAYAEQAH